jgi:hypothetical protein
MTYRRTLTRDIVLQPYPVQPKTLPVPAGTTLVARVVTELVGVAGPTPDRLVKIVNLPGDIWFVSESEFLEASEPVDE